MELTTYGLDIAKQVFQVHWVDGESGEIKRKKLKRAQMLEFFANVPVALVAMESCGSAHYWARSIERLGHAVRLIHPRFVRPFVKTNKNDTADAEAIWEAVQRPGMRFVEVKSESAQALAGLHRMRQSLVKFRTMQINQLRGLLAEFGVILPQGRQAALRALRSGCELSSVPELLGELLPEQLARLSALDAQIGAIEARLAAWLKQDTHCARLAQIPGVGVLTATAAAACMGNARQFASGREFAAFVGLTPRHSGTGGRTRLGHISKRGDAYLRTLLVHGARSRIRHGAARASPWLKRLLAAKPLNVAAVALANKTARTIWALLRHDRQYRADYATQAA
jgi:transposase